MADLAWLVQHGELDGVPLNGTSLIESLSILSLNSVNPSLEGHPEGPPRRPQRRHRGAEGALPAGEQQGHRLRRTVGRTPPGHALLGPALPLGHLRYAAPETVPQPWRPPYGASTPTQLYPYDVRTARNQLMVDGCLRWPAARLRRTRLRSELLPRTLILHGSNDLFCPVEWAEWERTRRGRRGWSSYRGAVTAYRAAAPTRPGGTRCGRSSGLAAETQLCVNLCSTLGSSMRLIGVRCCTPSWGVASGVRGVRVRARAGTGASRFHRLRRLPASGGSGPDRADAGVPVLAQGAAGGRSAHTTCGGS